MFRTEFPFFISLWMGQESFGVPVTSVNLKPLLVIYPYAIHMDSENTGTSWKNTIFKANNPFLKIWLNVTLLDP